MAGNVSHCPHVLTAQYNTWHEILIKRNADHCDSCEQKGPNLWVCLYSRCLYVGCGDSSGYDHSTAHGESNNHPLTMNLTTTRIWCYDCETEVFREHNQPPFPDKMRLRTLAKVTTSANHDHTAHSHVMHDNQSESSRSAQYEQQLHDDLDKARPPDPGDVESSSDEEEEDEAAKPTGLTGLQNIGNTCYMNAALQALSNCPPLTRFLLDCGGFVQGEKKPNLARSYKRLMEEMWSKRRPSYLTPSSVASGFKMVYPMFRGYSQQDSQEFLRCFMDQLHEELKQPIETSDEEDPSDDSEDDHAPSNQALSNGSDSHSNGSDLRGNGSLKTRSRSENQSVAHSSSQSAVSQSEDEYETCDSGLSSERSSMQNSMSSCEESLGSAEDNTLVAGSNQKVCANDGAAPDIAEEDNTSCVNTSSSENSPQHSSHFNTSQVSKLPSQDSGIQCMASSDESISTHDLSPQKEVKEAANMAAQKQYGCDMARSDPSIHQTQNSQHGDTAHSGIAQVHRGGSNRRKSNQARVGDNERHFNDSCGGNIVSTGSTKNKKQVKHAGEIKNTDKHGRHGNRNTEMTSQNMANGTQLSPNANLTAEVNIRTDNRENIDIPSNNRCVSDNTRSKSTTRRSTQNAGPRSLSPTTGSGNTRITRSRSTDRPANQRAGSADVRRSVSESCGSGSFEGQGRVYGKHGARDMAENEKLLRPRLRSASRHPPKERKKRRREYHSVISDVFDGRILSSVQCLTCERVSSTKETFQDLSLPIPSRDHVRVLATQPPHQRGASCAQTAAVHSSWVNSMFGWMRDWFWGPSITLQNCLGAFFSADELKGDNMYSCDKCNKLRNGIKYSKVLKLPEILCIHLKRFRHEFMYSSKINTFVSFPLYGLDVAPYLHKDCTDKITEYDLVAVICHHGTAGGGHYTSYGLNESNQHWYEFDDQCVTEVDPQQVENCEAYVLFYRKRNDKIYSVRKKADDIHKVVDNGFMKFWISRQWINKFNTFAEPGPISNHDFICSHGGVQPAMWSNVNAMAMEVHQSLWTYWHKKFGGGPAVTHLHQCVTCLEEQEQLKRRQVYERETFTRLHEEFGSAETLGAIHAISMHWFKQWENFVRAKTNDPPGPIDNSRICVMKQGTPQLRHNSDYGQVSMETWQFLHERYAGGPNILLQAGN